MTQETDYRRGRHCVFAIHAHLVFVTKYRRGVFRQEHLDRLHRILGDVCKDFDAELIEFNGERAGQFFLAACAQAVMSDMASSLPAKKFGAGRPVLAS